MAPLPHITCTPKAAPDAEHANRPDRSFRDAPSLELRQAWRSLPEPGFRPGTVRTLCTGRSFHIYAVLTDEDIYNPVTEFNQPAFAHGDVFEIFLKPRGQDAYFEFHVNPNNQQFCLTIPSAEAFRRQRAKGGIPPEWYNPDPVLDSKVWVEPEQHRWRVVATLTLREIARMDDWLFSFSRYDYTRGTAAPVLSSTSPHPEVDFHRQQDWGRLLIRR